MVGMGGLCGCGPGMDGGYVMVMPSVGGPESHWGVSRYLEFPWLREAKAETARLMRVFLAEDPREIRAHEGEFLDVMLYMGLVVTEGPCYFKGEDLEAWRRFHTWVRTALKDMYPDDPDYIDDWIYDFEVHVEGCP